MTDSTLPKASHVVNVKGSPFDIQMEVNTYLNKGYNINSRLIPWRIPGTDDTIFIQQVVLYEENENERALDDDSSIGGI